jgi:hypothetical protein
MQSYEYFLQGVSFACREHPNKLHPALYSHHNNVSIYQFFMVFEGLYGNLPINSCGFDGIVSRQYLNRWQIRQASGNRKKSDKKQLDCSENAFIARPEDCIPWHFSTKKGLQLTGSTKSGSKIKSVR